jgi:hypothetical protein
MSVLSSVREHLSVRELAWGEQIRNKRIMVPLQGTRNACGQHFYHSHPALQAEAKMTGKYYAS